MPSNICAFGDLSGIVFGEADPPTMLSYTSVFGERKEKRIIVTE